MKKSITLFLLIALIGLVIAQNPVKEKQKITVSKDTIKKGKPAIENPEAKMDTIKLVKEKYKIYKKSAQASYYADKFNGQKTSSGTRFDNNKYTAAHKKLAFGTKVKVTNEANGKSVIVVITDRGPFVRSRDIDLSKRAFMEIAVHSGNGGMKVTIAVLE